MDSHTHKLKPKAELLTPRLIINLIFIVAILIVVAINAISFSQVTKFVNANKWVVHTYRVIQTVSNVYNNILQMETATRGFALTQDPSLLSEFNTQQAVMNENIRYALYLTQDNPSQVTRIHELKPLLAQKIEMMHQVIAGTKTADPKLLPMVKEGQDLTTTIAERVHTITGEEFSLLQQRNVDSVDNLSKLNQILLTASLLSILIFLLSIVILNINLARQNRYANDKKRYENILKGVIDGTKDVIYALDLNYHFMIFNNSFEHEFKFLYGNRPMLGASILDYLAHLPDEQNKIRSLWERALTGEDFSIVGEFGSLRNNQQIYDCNFSPIYNEQGLLAGASAICRNIYLRLESEKSLQAANDKLEHAYEELKHHDTEISTLNDMESTLQSSNSIDETLTIINMYCQKLLKFASGAIYLINSSRNYLEAVAEWNSPQPYEKVFSPEQCWGLRQGKNYFYINPEVSLHCEHVAAKNLLPYLCMPLLAQNDIIGMLHIEVNQSVAKTEPEVRALFKKHELLIGNLAVQLALAVANIKLRETLKIRSIRDPLTGLYNRAYLSEFLERDLQRAKRNKVPISIVMMDVDHFKKLNDRFGHDAGDMVLKSMGKIIQEHMRSSDIACRYGGEEFLLILYETDMQAATEIIDRLRVHISNMDLTVHGALLNNITASFGLSVFPDDANELEALITAADLALYKSKKSGRNRLTIYDIELAQPPV